MNSENFSSFLQDPSKLYQIPYQELKSLVVQYPYCQPLRILLLQKSQMERHPDFERNLHAAATYLPDRTLLYFLVREFQALESGELLFELEEERLELKSLSEIFSVRQEEEQAAAIQQQTGPTAAPGPTVDVREEEEEDLEEKLIVPGRQEEASEKPLEEEIEPAAETADSVEVKVEAKPITPSFTRAPQPKSAFTSWQRRYDHLRLAASLNALDIPPPPPPKKAAPSVPKTEPNPNLAQDLARRSLEEKEDRATETLAELLSRQGHYQRAIAMYEKLCLIFPEKSSFFALKIEKLKHK